MNRTAIPFGPVVVNFSRKTGIVTNARGLLPDMSGMPLDDIRSILAGTPDRDETAARAAYEHQRDLVFPVRERGRLASLAVWLAGWQGRATPAATRIELSLFAGAQGQEGLEGAALHRAIDDVRTRVLLLSAGGGAPNAVGVALGAGLKVFDLAVERPTPNPARGAAMTDRECVAAMAFGMEAVAGQADILCVGAIGVGTRIAAAGVAMALMGGAPSDWLAGHVGDYARAVRHLEAVTAAEHWRRGDPLAILQHLGCRELAAVTGAILAARVQRMPVVLDGFEALVAAAVLARLRPGAVDHCLVAGRDGSSSHDRIITHLQFEPLLDLQVEGGDGLTALLAGQILRAACELHGGLATHKQMQQLLNDLPPL